ncbi:MAG: FAD-dependent oxidoreductase [Phycisphaerales bacterium]|nr:MAG: FAD-dependent oxidoreductase [Phycisphaerales bacterium]
MSMFQRYKVDIADASYFRESIKCQNACPVGTDACGYVRAIAHGDFERAYLIARGPNPLASICGRVCGAPCEVACRRCNIDQPVSIRALKRSATEDFAVRSGGFEPLELLRNVIDSIKWRHRLSGEDLAVLAEAFDNCELRQPTGEKVAIIGSGPAGLAAGHDLALMGLRPTIYELEPVPAGMLALGIPEYRLPRDLIRAEIEVIRQLGVEIICNTKVGKDIDFDDIREMYAATVIAVGAKRSRRLKIPGHDGIGVMGGVDLLRAVALNQPSPLSDRVVVIGGGNVAFDVSRTVIRQAGMDVSRTALRAEGVREVHMCCLESLEEMPADDIEIIEGNEEGVKLRPSMGPKEIHLDDQGRVRAVSFKRVLSVFDKEGRFAPKFDENDITTIEADTVLWAIGQQADLSFLDPVRDGIELGERGAIIIDSETQQSSAPDVFVTGDVAHGVGLMIEAIASGKRVARSIYSYLRGSGFDGGTRGRYFALSRFARERDYETLKRLRAPAASVEERMIGQNIEVEKTYSHKEARWEAARCLECSVNTIFDSSKCLLCGGCVDVCPEGCIRIVSVSQLEANSQTDAVLDAMCGETPREQASAIIKDEARCIRCALCADRCPAGAITMEMFSFEGKWHAKRTERTAVRETN